MMKPTDGAFFLWWFEVHRPHQHIRRWDTYPPRAIVDLKIVRRAS
jgi:hypothetical protein